MIWNTLQHWLADTRLVRRVVDTFCRRFARRHLAALDHQDPARKQAQTLRGLVHKGHNTQFGREHDFRRIRTAADFRRLVPLRTPKDFRHHYFQPNFPHLGGVTWPGPVWVPSTFADESASLMPATPDLLVGHRAAAWTFLALALAARPKASLFAGRLLLVRDSDAPIPFPGLVYGTGGTERWMPPFPSWLFPFTILHYPKGKVGLGPEGGLPVPTKSSSGVPLTSIAGQAEVLGRFFAISKRESGWKSVGDIWPTLTAVFYQGRPGGQEREQLVQEMGENSRVPPVLFLETCIRPEGAIAVEDPRHGCLRLLTNHGVYFEFVPMDCIDRPNPKRYNLEEVQPQVPYALAITSAAGLWACLTSVQVLFTRRNPPLLRLLDLGLPAALSRKSIQETIKPGSLPPPLHPRHGDTGARRPGRFGHISWSRHADRG